MMKELPKVYEPQQVESKIYRMWEENGFFRSPQDLLLVPGIGEGILEKIQPYIEFG
jgi:DNA uptake protein ComE-like DNA-binding protein